MHRRLRTRPEQSHGNRRALGIDYPQKNGRRQKRGVGHQAIQHDKALNIEKKIIIPFFTIQKALIPHVQQSIISSCCFCRRGRQGPRRGISCRTSGMTSAGCRASPMVISRRRGRRRHVRPVVLRAGGGGARQAAGDSRQSVALPHAVVVHRGGQAVREAGVVAGRGQGTSSGAFRRPLHRSRPSAATTGRAPTVETPCAAGGSGT